MKYRGGSEVTPGEYLKQKCPHKHRSAEPAMHALLSTTTSQKVQLFASHHAAGGASRSIPKNSLLKMRELR